MRYRLLGQTGLRVSELFLGAMTFGGEYTPPEEGRRILDRYADAGGNVVNTASAYGESEDILGELLEGRRDRFVLATKYTLSRDGSDPNAAGNHRKNLTLSLERSLRRLRTDYIDLYWVHIWDRHTPVGETMRALDDAVRAGKILYVGISDTPAWQVARANTIAEFRGWSAFVGLQIRYSLLDRDAEHDLLPMAQALDLAITPWDTLGSGVLTGKYNDGAGDGGRAGMRGDIPQRSLDIAAEVVAVAKDLGCTPAQVALAWVRGGRGVIVPLVGAKTRAQLDDNLGCLDVELGDEHRARLDTASEIRLPFPHNMLVQFERSNVVNHRPSQR